MVRWNINSDFGDLVFQAPAAGEYYVYYFPFDPRPQDRDRVVTEEKARYVAPRSSRGSSLGQSKPAGQNAAFPGSLGGSPLGGCHGTGSPFGLGLFLSHGGGCKPG